MSKAEESKMKRIMNKLDEDISWIINHLGIKPVNGGSPPSERRDIKVKILIIGEALVWFKTWEM